MSDWREQRRHRDRDRRDEVMTLPVLRVRHHSVIGGRDGDVPTCASVGPAGEVAALWTTPEGLGPVTSTTVSAAGAWFPDPAAARPAAARITVHTPDLAAVTRIADLALAHIICSPCAARRSQAPDTAHPYKAGRSSFRLRAPPRIRQIPCLPAPGYYRTASYWSRTVLPRVTDYPTSSRTRTAVLGGSWLRDDHVLGHADRGDLCCRGRGRPRSIDVREPMSEYESMAAVAALGGPGRGELRRRRA
jgi:hypothetical protein